jgi:hypothetical protein
LNAILVPLPSVLLVTAARRNEFDSTNPVTKRPKRERRTAVVINASLRLRNFAKQTLFGRTPGVSTGNITPGVRWGTPRTPLPAITMFAFYFPQQPSPAFFFAKFGQRNLEYLVPPVVLLLVS